MGFFSEFRDFAVKGNVIDMAVGIIIGLAFGKIVSSLVNDVIMPPVGLLTGGLDFSGLFIDLSGGSYATVAEAKAASAPVIAYGLFINTVIEFLIIAFVIFLMIRWINRMKKEEKKPAAPPQPSEDVKLLTEIRDLLKKA